MFGIARGLIGCEWIELVEATPLAEQGYLLLIDDEEDTVTTEDGEALLTEEYEEIQLDQ